MNSTPPWSRTRCTQPDSRTVSPDVGRGQLGAGMAAIGDASGAPRAVRADTPAPPAAVKPSASRAGISPRSELPTQSRPRQLARPQHRLAARAPRQQLGPQHPGQQPAGERRRHQPSPRSAKTLVIVPSQTSPRSFSEQRLVHPRRQRRARRVVRRPPARLQPRARDRPMRAAPRRPAPSRPPSAPPSGAAVTAARPVERQRQPHPQRPSPAPRQRRGRTAARSNRNPSAAAAPRQPRQMRRQPQEARPRLPAERLDQDQIAGDQLGEARLPQRLLVFRRRGRIGHHPAADVQHRLAVRIERQRADRHVEARPARPAPPSRSRRNRPRAARARARG